MSIKPYAALFMLLCSTQVSAGHVTKILAKKVIEHTTMCNETSDFTKLTGQTCNVKKVRFETHDYSVKEDEDPIPYYGTLAYFGFETKSWADVTKYAFVQRIRGCTYEVTKEKNGTITKRIGESIMHLGKKRIYVFPEWSNDATTKDPLYYGPTEEDADLPGGRVSLYRWTPKLGVIDAKKTKDLYEMIRLTDKQRNGATPAVFVTDTPSMAYPKGDLNTFQNVSLEFQMCLYNIKDIPETIDNDHPIKATPIVCHDWNSQFEYDFKKKDYVNLPNKGLDPFCASQVPKNPAEVYEEEVRNR